VHLRLSIAASVLYGRSGIGSSCIRSADALAVNVTRVGSKNRGLGPI
jgi:hypothetical protein